jgi:ABC-type phosphate/phosphonate transport system substrate-binding protein
VITQRLYASFPWYDLPEMHGAVDAFYAVFRTALAARGVHDAPPALDRARDHGTDAAGACFFTQTCGYPLFTTARNHFTVLGAPCYTAPGCEGPMHRSYIVVRDDAPYRALADLRGTRFAINEPDSNSGMNLPRRLVAPLARDGRFFSDTVVSGGHVRSAELVAAGDAHAAAIDCVTYALLRRYRPNAIAALRVIGETAATPTPPLVTSVTTPEALVAAMRAALADVMHAPEHAALRDALLLADIAACDERAYAIVMTYEREAAALGYRDLR